jgi:hypothetical protein
MLDGTKSLRAWLLIGATGVVTASCSGSGGSGLDDSPASLVSKCDQICNNVLMQCTSTTFAPDTCTSACNDLYIAPSSCLNPLASYLVCAVGATSVAVTCGPSGDGVFVSPQSCEADREATLNCNASPGLVSACIALPLNASCTVPPEGGGTNPVFCVGAPMGCAPPSPNPLGIGVYCCPPS